MIAAVHTQHCVNTSSISVAENFSCFQAGTWPYCYKLPYNYRGQDGNKRQVLQLPMQHFCLYTLALQLCCHAYIGIRLTCNGPCSEVMCLSCFVIVLPVDIGMLMHANPSGGTHPRPYKSDMTGVLVTTSHMTGSNDTGPCWER